MMKVVRRMVVRYKDGSESIYDVGGGAEVWISGPRVDLNLGNFTELRIHEEEG